jgi:hypothetical protein
MKNTVKFFVLATILLCIMVITQSSLAQPPPPPPAEKGTDNNQAPSEAPIGNGTTLLLTFAMSYAVSKVYEIHAVPTVE